jgi:hypothetical protein
MKLDLLKRILIFFFFLVIVLLPEKAKGAVLSVSPSSGSFEVGSLLEISLFLDTQGETINALAVDLSFPPEKLQLVSPSLGQSIIGVWTTPPTFNNQTGKVFLQGVIPNGINVEKALITKLTFRIKAPGQAIIRFLDGSRVLLHDGKGTDALRNTINGVFNFSPPPPAGPIVSSPTHPDPSLWYPNSTVSLTWALEDEVEGYSYVLNKEFFSNPDDISEGKENFIAYNNLADGEYYFHIKALKNGRWGGVTHFGIKIDTTPPADFPIRVIPGARTTRKNPVLEFATTDLHSGLSHYELKVIPLKAGTSFDQYLFIEVQSPYILSLDFGSYDVIIRAYDKSGNFRDVTKRLTIVNAVFRVLSDKGVEVGSNFIIPWLWFWIFAAFLLFLLIYGAWRVSRWHRLVHQRHLEKDLPSYIKEQLKELQEYRKKYGSKIMMLLIFLFLSFFFGDNSLLAKEEALNPPIITLISENISNEEIFYVGGKTEIFQSEVLIYLQNIETGETINRVVVSDKRGDWFYRHDQFLPSGKYILWAQSKQGEELSPPTPQKTILVYPVALQFGASRLSYTTIYLLVISILLIIVVGLIGYTIYHLIHGRRKHLLFLKEVKEAEESVRRGFAVLRRDIQAQLALLQKAKLSKTLSEEEERISAQLLKDLEQVERYIGKEIWDVEKIDYGS